jgi:hypothetical protein
MKSVLSSPDDSNNIEKRSDMIKSEIAKYRLLKSKGAIGSNEETKENSSSSKILSKNSSSGFCSPSKAEAFNNIPSGLQGSYLQNDGSLTSSKTETRPSSTKRSGNSQPLQIQNASPVGSFSEREKIRADGFLSPTAKELSKSYMNSGSKNSRPTNLSSSGYTEKNGFRNKSPTPAGQNQKWEKIEEFVDTELEKELLTKSVQKNSTPKTHLNYSNSKAQEIAAQKRASSATDTKSKRLRENKNFTPNSSKNVTEENSNRKHSVPDSPLAEDLVVVSQRNALTPIHDHKNQPLIRAAQNKQMQSPHKADVESEKGLKEEVDKWRIFGKMMAESYDDLNKKYTEYTKDKEKDKKIVIALKEQVRTLKALLKAGKEEGKSKSKENSEYSSKKGDDHNKELLYLTKELEVIRKENQETVKVLEFLKDENEILKKSVEEGQKQKQLAEHYQKLADVRFKECSALAEEIICLRTDLDRSHSNYLRIQREQNSGKKANIVDGFLSAKKLRQTEPLGLLGTGGSSTTKNMKRAEVKVSNWTDEIDDEPPLPADFNAIPSKEENALI